MMSLMMTVSQMTREGHHGQVGGRAPATLAVNRGLFLGAPRPVEGHRRQWPSWPSIISYPVCRPRFNPLRCPTGELTERPTLVFLLYVPLEELGWSKLMTLIRAKIFFWVFVFFLPWATQVGFMPCLTNDKRFPSLSYKNSL